MLKRGISKFRTTKFDVKKLETYRSIVWCDTYFDILDRLGMDHECDGRTDGRTTVTDRMAFRNSAL